MTYLDTAPRAHQPLLTRADKAEKLTADPGGTITLLADSASTGGTVSAHRSTFRNGFDGAPPHYHEHATEVFFVLTGELEVLLDEQIVVLDAGDLLVVPPRVPHAFAAAPGADADILFVFTQGGDRFDYYRLLDEAHRGAASWDAVADPRFDNHFVDSAAWQAASAQRGAA